MGLLGRLSSAVGIGGAKVEMGVEAGNHQEGAFAMGTVVVRGGVGEQVCDGLSVEVRQWRGKVEVINGESRTVQHKETLVAKNLAPSGFAIKPGSEHVFQFRIYLPAQGKTEIVAMADIPGALDPSATATIDVHPGRQGFLPRTMLLRTEGKPGAKDVSRIGGKPIGIDAKRWPLFEGKAMTHLLTVDLHTLDLPFVPRNRALALFCLNPDDNGAYEAGNPYTRVVLISPQDIKKGEPTMMPAHTQLPFARLETKPLSQQDARTFFGGTPKYLQGDPFQSHDFDEGLQRSIESGGFYFQFDESLVPMNLGDSGVMYVFERTAFWQCH